MIFSRESATFQWNAAQDTETPAPALTYNLRIGTTPGGSDILSPMAGSSGRLRVPQMGNAQLGTSATFQFKEGAPYYWSVQAVDGAFAASPFSEEKNFRVLPTQTVVVPATATNTVPGDTNNDRVVDTNELQNVLASFWENNPWLHMTNAAKLQDGFFQFALTNDSVWNFSVEVTTNFTDWNFLGPAYPVYEFLDTASTNEPQRYYRLRWP
jgi:hypothetical protein